MDLVRDVLDKKVIDRNGREMGRVDGIVLTLRRGTPPRVAALELGPAVLAHRLRPILGRWVAGLEHAFGIDEGRPLRIPFGAVLNISDQVKVDLAFGETAAATVEQRLRRWISSIPRSS
jgi:sporulation protein YlmC with PRC-barrel domain